ncbi:MAG TPA: SDR family NAD(P)-dependent oxidoreductase [Conexibacter sp.]|nr:SDR family NAD(P)-dependent oxidoreductase [Conexibacter sp.]
MIAERLSDTLAGGMPLLEGRTVILTGAGGGIGRAIARVLVSAGARVALTDLHQEPLDTLSGELSQAGVVRGHDAGLDAEARLLTQAIDAADPAAFAALHARASAELGPVDGLVNCAGLFEKRTHDELDAAAWTRILTANLLTTAAGCQAVLPAMIARGSGSIVNVASTAGEYGSISPARHYAAAKGGVIGLTKSLAREAAPAQVRVNAVSPGPVDTDGLLAATPEQKAIAGSRTLFGRLGQPEEIAGACIFLLSPLSTFVTGHVLRVNGGALL